jgi:hypothetical protein
MAQFSELLERGLNICIRVQFPAFFLVLFALGEGGRDVREGERDELCLGRGERRVLFGKN